MLNAGQNIYGSGNFQLFINNSCKPEVNVGSDCESKWHGSLSDCRQSSQVLTESGEF